MQLSITIIDKWHKSCGGTVIKVDENLKTRLQPWASVFNISQEDCFRTVLYVTLHMHFDKNIYAHEIINTAVRVYTNKSAMYNLH